MIERKFLAVNNVRLSYIDFDGHGTPLLALHGHFSCGRTFAGLADALGKHWRVVALDQRGHGWSDSPADCSREAYVHDVARVIQRLNLAPVIVLGHSLGGVNAYQLAARHPTLVRALIIEDIGAVVNTPSPVVWPKRFPSVKAVYDFLTNQVSNISYFLESLVEYKDGWGFRFKLRYINRSRQSLAGDWWNDWLVSTCPTLLLHGHKSFALATEHAREMATRRPNTHLVEFPHCGHVIHDEDPRGYFNAVKEFLSVLP
ncbi:MAG: alpha/beta hydrolase [Candidatus Korarchaeota archaeon]|nr:alpha/beta hydrolase [Candidatus Korarchaeota archaeon]NIU84913.1 alpha/beta fold hydrolase [Candidatus Thorarchaeota archaeon]NIW15726.1 alpha/beta fold hydrolase [Candidatus Thorarchaeota archaeon]NIW53651.1 alpha/beta fold hydrolase [Candidatus Korarchaeota archaeon]